MFKFGNLDSFKNDVGRNTFDMSFGTNATFKMGKLYPVFIKEVLPRDTWRIDTKVAIQMMPTVFPLKTRLRCFVHFFYVKNRTLWKDWQRFINDSYGLGNENYNIVPPYIQHDYDLNLHGTGSLADYLGWPTALPKQNVNNDSVAITRSSDNATTVYPLDSPQFNELLNEGIIELTQHTGYNLRTSVVGSPFDLVADEMYSTNVYSIKEEYRDSFKIAYFDFTYNKRLQNSGEYQYTIANISIVGDNDIIISDDLSRLVPEDGGFVRLICSPNGTLGHSISISWRIGYINPVANNSIVHIHNHSVNSGSSYDFAFAWWNGMNISALPFRAYESVYNAYYRNWQADPLLDAQGRPNYDTYVRNVEGGADSLDYDFYLRNYEKDMFTSAHPTPQMGVAPLVGISALGSATFSVDGTEYNLQAQFEDDNETIKDFKMTSSIPNSVALAATNLQGISINDLRSVNALQRYLENGVRASYKYRNQIAAHFGAAPEFDTVDMPLFIGGIATDLGQNVTQTTANYSDSFGNEIPAGTPISNGYFAYDGNDTIEKYCDEHGFIIGILSIVPIPNYPQGLSPMWRKEDYMRYFTPEMGHLGYQPIKSNEIALFRQLSDTRGQVIPDSEVFGYQRSWYEYCGSNDEVHGEFRTTMRDYMLSRWFSDIPKLDPDFIGVDSSKLSYIFADNHDNDKFVGQLYFSAFAKRCIPEYGTPKLD